MTDQQTVTKHYGGDELEMRVHQALQHAGLEEGVIGWRDLAPLDQFHVRGLAASDEMAAGLNLTPGATVLDVGCGLGGPARYLAAVHGAQVTGIDLSQRFIDIARMLTERTALTGRAVFEQGDALDLPFPDQSFDCAWTQHVAMNIADRGRLYGGILRVLKPGGRLAVYDVTAGEGGPAIYPVPWARTEELSFLLTPEQMRDALHRAGFKELSWADQTEAGVAWNEARRSSQSDSGLPPLGLHVIMGDDFPGMFANLSKNLKEKRVRLIQTVLQKPS